MTRPGLAPTFAALVLASCSPESGAVHAAGGELAGKLTLTGSSTLAPLVAEIGKRFEALHSAVRVDVQSGGTSRGIADARAGTAEIGMVSRELTADERADLLGHAIARDGVCMIVNAENPVSELSDQQIVGIYLGRITRWSEVGGPEAEITVVNKAEGRATLAVFSEHFGIDPQAIQADVVIGENEQGILTVAGDPHAIGYVSIGTAETEARGGAQIRLLPIGGVPASSASLESGRYALARPLQLVTLGPPDGLSHAFIEYCRSSAVHDLVRELGFVPAPGGDL